MLRSNLVTRSPYCIVFFVVSFRVTVNPPLIPSGGGGGGYLFQAHLRGGLNRDKGLILEGGGLFKLKRRWNQFSIKNENT